MRRHSKHSQESKDKISAAKRLPAVELKLYRQIAREATPSDDEPRRRTAQED
jgi:hypothetical protein